MYRRRFLNIMSWLLALLILIGSVPADVNAESTDTTNLALQESIEYYKTVKNGVLQDWWELLAVYTAGEDLSDYVMPEAKTISDNTLPSDYAGIFISELIKGNMLSKVDAQRLADKQNAETGSFGYNMSNQQAWAIFALDLYNRNVHETERVSYNNSKAIDFLLTFQTGGNFYYSNDYPYPGVDYTGAAALALAPYAGTDTWPEALDINHLIAGLKYDRMENGSYGNAGAAAYAIFGYNALGVARDHVDYIAALEELLTYQVDDGGFYSPWADLETSDAYYTKQATLALAETLGTASGSSAFLDLQKNTSQYISIDLWVQTSSDIVSRKYTAPVATTAEEAVTRAVPAETDLTDYLYFINGELSEGSSVLNYGDSVKAVPPGTTHIASLTAVDTEITIGQSLNIVLTATPVTEEYGDANLSGSSILVNGQVATVINEDDGGVYNFAPHEAGIYQFSVEWPSGSSYSSAAFTVTVNSMNQAIPVSIRVEGIEENILYDDSFVVNGSKSLLTVFDAITQALNSYGIPFDATEEGLFNSINGIENDTTYQTSVYWMYTINEQKYLDGSTWVMPKTLIEENDEIIVYCGSSASFPFVQSSLQENGDVKLTFTSYQYDSNWNTVLLPLTDMTVIWAETTGDEYTGLTDSDGNLTIPSQHAEGGEYSLQIEKLDPNLIPLVVRLSPEHKIAVSTSGTGDSGSNPGSSVPKVTISVIGPNNDILKAETQYTYSEGMTALELLRRTGLSIGYSDSSRTYVSRIGEYEEFDYGPSSGWLFKVNGDEAILSSASSYRLDEEDEVVWFYTTDYTNEKGSKEWQGETLPEEDSHSVTDSELDDLLKEVNEGSRASWTVKLTEGEITLDNDALTDLIEQVDGKSVSFMIQSIDRKDLTAKQRDAAGDRPVYDISIFSDNTQITEFGEGKITISLKYTLKDGELPKGIVIYYLDADGKLTEQKGSYDPISGKVTFTVDHLSYYVIGYDADLAVWPFADVIQDDSINWFYTPVKYAYVNGIFSGTSSATFEPNSPMTRAMLVSVIARLHRAEMTGYTDTPFTDVDLDTWYGPAVVWAESAGIISGYVKDGKMSFDPNAMVTRQDLASILYRYAEKYREDLIETNNEAIEFVDQKEIADYALDAVTAMQKAGIINGVQGLNGRSFLPISSATRAETATMFYNMLEKK